MVNIGHQDRLKALDTLLNARMAHTLWVAEVTHRRAPCVIEDHTQCAFGKWLLEAGAILGGVPEFRTLVEPHRQLHQAYTAMKNDADPAALHDTTRKLSGLLIDGIDRLEKYLNQPAQG